MQHSSEFSFPSSPLPLLPSSPLPLLPTTRTFPSLHLTISILLPTSSNQIFLPGLKLFCNAHSICTPFTSPLQLHRHRRPTQTTCRKLIHLRHQRLLDPPVIALGNIPPDPLRIVDSDECCLSPTKPSCASSRSRHCGRRIIRQFQWCCRYLRGRAAQAERP